MPFTHLEISNFRNLSNVKVFPHANVNIFYGENGSGKTSFLEAVYYLTHGRSFRASSFKQLIQKEKEEFTVFSKFPPTQAGIRRHQDGNLHIKIENNTVSTIAELANMFPLQLINADSYQLLNAGPKFRRNFIDWGVFHVEHQQFMPAWKKIQRILKHRNAALKLNFSSPEEQIILWDDELIKATTVINKLRREYIEHLSPILTKVFTDLLGNNALKLIYYPGWNENLLYSEVLKNSLKQDIRMKHTQYGPHKADLKIYVNNSLADELLSRGQQKILVCAMQLAQSLLLEEKNKKKTIFLIDDLPSELDEERRSILCNFLLGLNTQLFITGIEHSAFQNLFSQDQIKLFHVEHGSIFEKNMD